MNIYKWIILAWLFFSALSLVLSIDKPRKPIGEKTAGLALTALTVLAILVVVA